MKKCLSIFGLLLVNFAGHAQCLTSSIRINTAYNPVTGVAIPFGFDGGAPVTDPKWILTAVSPGVAPALPLTLPYLPLGSTLTEVLPGANADIIQPAPGGWTSNPPG